MVALPNEVRERPRIPPGPVSPLALDALMQLSSQRRTGTLYAGEHAWTLVDGAALDRASLREILLVPITREPMWFVDAEVAHDGPLLRLLPHLWDLARRGSERSSLRNRATHVLRPGAWFERVAELPVGELTRQVLDGLLDGDCVLGEVESPNVGARVGFLDDVVALLALGVVRLEWSDATLDDTGPRDALEAGQLALERGDVPRAVACLRVAATGPDSSAANAWLALALLSGSDRELPETQRMARLLLEVAYAVDPDCAEARYVQARIAMLRGELLPAHQTLMDLLRDQPRHQRAEALLNEVRSELRSA